MILYGETLIMTIKKANENDKEFVLYANKMIDKASYIENSNLYQNIDRDLFENGKAVCLVAKESGQNIGMIMFSKVYWADRGQGIYVSQIFVEKEYRQKGVFKKLLKTAINYYKTTRFFTCLVSRKNKKMLCCMKKLRCKDENMSTFVLNVEDLRF